MLRRPLLPTAFLLAAVVIASAAWYHSHQTTSSAETRPAGRAAESAWIVQACDIATLRDLSLAQGWQVVRELALVNALVIERPARPPRRSAPCRARTEPDPSFWLGPDLYTSSQNLAHDHSCVRMLIFINNGAVPMIKTTTLLTIALHLPMNVQAQEDRAQAFQDSFAETQQRLSLTEDQRLLVEPIVRAQFDATRAVMKKYGLTPGAEGQGGASTRDLRAMSKELKPLRKQADKELASVLSREQMKAYREIQEERQAQMRAQIKQRRSSR